MIAINTKYYSIDKIKELLEDNILFGAPCGCRPVDESDVRMKSKYSKHVILSNYMNLEEQDIDFILDEYDRLSKNI